MKPIETSISRRRLLQTGAMAASVAALPALATRPLFAAEALSGSITMIKGPHSADEAKFEAMIINDFKSVAPDVDVIEIRGDDHQ